eukprot:symbB.v1.2.012214.t1/scaffold833.1/size175488/4
MSNLKHFIALVAYLLVLITMVKQGKNTIKQIASVDDQTPEPVEQDVKIEDVAVKVDLPQVETVDEAPAESASSTTVPTFEKKKVVKKIGDIEQAFIDKCNNANEDEKKKILLDLHKEAKLAQDKIEWMKQQFNIEEKKTKRSTAIEGQVS